MLRAGPRDLAVFRTPYKLTKAFGYINLNIQMLILLSPVYSVLCQKRAVALEKWNMRNTPKITPQRWSASQGYGSQLHDWSASLEALCRQSLANSSIDGMTALSWKACKSSKSCALDLRPSLSGHSGLLISSRHDMLTRRSPQLYGIKHSKIIHCRSWWSEQDCLARLACT